jgi:hypothetical protein
VWIAKEKDLGQGPKFFSECGKVITEEGKRRLM